MEQEFIEVIQELLDSDAVQRLKQFTHHKTGTRFEHCLYVSYRSYRMAKWLGLDARAAARGGLLHDLFFYDWRDKEPGRGWHVTAHPRRALIEATRLFDLTDKEKDIIVKHMWPMSPWMPKYAESFIVSIMDKYCAMMEGLVTGKRKLTKMGLAHLTV